MKDKEVVEENEEEGENILCHTPQTQTDTVQFENRETPSWLCLIR